MKSLKTLCYACVIAAMGLSSGSLFATPVRAHMIYGTRYTAAAQNVWLSTSSGYVFFQKSFPPAFTTSSDYTFYTFDVVSPDGTLSTNLRTMDGYNETVSSPYPSAADFVDGCYVVISYDPANSTYQVNIQPTPPYIEDSAMLWVVLVAGFIFGWMLLSPLEVN